MEMMNGRRFGCHKWKYCYQICILHIWFAIIIILTCCWLGLWYHFPHHFLFIYGTLLIYISQKSVCTFLFIHYQFLYSLPNLTKSNKRAYLLVIVRVSLVFDDVSILIDFRILHYRVTDSLGHGVPQVCFAWHAKDPEIEPGSVRNKTFKISLQVLAPSPHLGWNTSAELGL